jgi:hypothetical protein
MYEDSLIYRNRLGSRKEIFQASYYKYPPQRVDTLCSDLIQRSVSQEEYHGMDRGSELLPEVI